MLAFHNDPDLKVRILEALNLHIEADTLVQGTYWDGHRGCAVGCVLREMGADPHDHSGYEELLSIPLELAVVHDFIFEVLDEPLSQSWAKDFIEAIPVGKDLTGVWQSILSKALLRAPWKGRFERAGIPAFDTQNFLDCIVTRRTPELTERTGNIHYGLCYKLVRTGCHVATCGQFDRPEFKSHDISSFLIRKRYTMSLNEFLSELWAPYSSSYVRDLVLCELKKDESV